MRTVTRRSVVATAVLGLAGCSIDDGNGGYGGGGTGDGNGTGDGDGTDSLPANPTLASAERTGSLAIRSAAFNDSGDIPRKYGRDAENVNPPLEIDGTPDDAGTLAIVVDDPDAVAVVGEIFVHWLVWNVPSDTTAIPEDWGASAAVEGENDFGTVGYGGPAPPDDPHSYRFNCFAVDGTLALAAGASVDDLGPALSGNVLASAQLSGTYAP
jgi:Raf kinase inhibitor-like YbhB/YbcL family protein